MFAGEAIFGCGLLLVPTFRRQLAAMLRLNTVALLAISGSSTLIDLGGGLGNRYALMFAPLSVVQAIGSTTMLFVFAIGVVLSLFWPKFGRQNPAAREFAQNGIAAALVTAGVTLVTL